MITSSPRPSLSTFPLRSFVRSIDETKIARASVRASSSPLTPHRPSPSRASHRRLLKGDASSPAPSPQLLRALVPVLFPSILRGLLDSVEKVREKCAQLVADVLDALPDPMVGPDGDVRDGWDGRDGDDGEGATAVALPSLLPAMVKIVGTAPVEEPSEEIRLSCVELTTRAVMRATTIAGGNASGEKTATTSTLLLPFAEDVAAVVHASSGDQFHDVKRACAALVEAIARATPRGALPPASAMKMLKATLANARHRHSSVRLAVVAAVDALHRAGAVPDAAVPETLAPGTRPLCADRAPAVRAAFHKALAGWMTTSSGGGGEGVGRGGGGGERRGDHRDCGKVPPGLVDVETTADADDDAVKRGCALPRARWLLPMLLTGVADETEANGVAALELVRVVGEANDAALGIGGLGGEGASDEAGVDDRTARVLPPPFAGAPPPGARRLVRALLPSLLPLALRETKEWTAAQRNAGARLLGTTLAFAQSEAADARYLSSVIAALNAAVSDEDADTAERVVGAARILGAFVLLTLVPIRPRSRGERRSLRTLLYFLSRRLFLSAHHASLTIPTRLDAFRFRF